MYTLDGQVLKEGESFEDSSGNLYPANWLTVSTTEEKTAIGIVITPDPVTSSSPSYDRRFYSNATTPKDLNNLKIYWVEEVKETCNKLLVETDWMIIRAADPSAGLVVPMEVQTDRALIRTRCNEKETAINACTTVPELENYIKGVEYQIWLPEPPAEPEPEDEEEEETTSETTTVSGE